MVETKNMLSLKKEIDLNKCKKKGNPGEQCGCRCLWMCTDKGADKENPLPPRFMKCVFLDW